MLKVPEKIMRVEASGPRMSRLHETFNHLALEEEEDFLIVKRALLLSPSRK